MIENLLIVGLSNALVGAGLAVVVLVVTRMWRRAPLAHLLWLVVLLKLVTPPLWILPISIPVESTRRAGGATEFSRHSSTDNSEIAGATVITPRPESLFDSQTNTGASGSIAGDPRTPAQRGAARVKFADAWLTWPHAAVAAWLTGALAMMATVLVRVHRFRRVLRRASVAPRKLRQEVAQLAELAQVRSVPDIRVSDARVVPLVFGIGGRVVLLLPKSLLSSLNEEERTTLLAHELAHLRRRDHSLTWFTMLVVTLYWWHPVAWFARRQLCRAADECCDGWVVKWFPENAVSYTESMMKALDYLATGPQGMVGLASEFGQLKFLNERFEMVLHNHTSHRLVWYVRLPVAAAAILLLLVSPLFTLAEASSENVQSRQQEAENRAERDEGQGEPATENTPKPDDKNAVTALERLGATMQSNEEGNVLAFHFKEPPTDEAIELLKGLPALQGVGLHDSGARGTDLTFIKEFPNLKSLWLDNDQLDNEGISHVRQLPSLEKLFLRGEGIDDATLVLLDDLPNLTFLHLSNTRVTEDGLNHLSNLKKLESLGISNLDWERSHPQQPQFTDDVLARLAGCDNLKSLMLHFGTRVSDAGLKHLEGFEKLESLKLYSEKITDAGLAHLGKMKSLKSISIDAPRPSLSRRLRTSSVSRSTLSDAGLAHLSDLIELEELSIRNGQFTDAGMAHLSRLVKLKNLSLSRAAIGDEGLSHLKGLVNLERFICYGTQFTDDGIRQLAGMTKLQYLDLSRSGVTDKGLEHLEGLINLTYLGLNGTDVTDAGLAHLKGLTKLQSLSLDDTKIRGEGFVHFAGLTGLTSLHLGVTRISDESLQHLAALHSLHTLWLNGTTTSDDGLAHLRPLTELTTLSLTGTRITDAGLQHLTGLEKLGFLTLGGGELTDRGMVHLAELSALHSLHIHEAQITNTGMESLGRLVNLNTLSVDRCPTLTDEALNHLKGLTKLNTLHLNGTSITGTGFAHIKELPDITWVSLYKCRVDDAGLEQIGKLTSLKMLNLTDNEITDDGLKHLGGMQHLTQLQIERTLVTREGVDRLKELLPDTDINY